MKTKHRSVALTTRTTIGECAPSQFRWLGDRYAPYSELAVDLRWILRKDVDQRPVDRIHYLSHMCGLFPLMIKRVFETTRPLAYAARFRPQLYYIVLMRLFCKLHSSVDEPRCASEARTFLYTNLESDDCNQLWMIVLALRKMPKNQFTADSKVFGCKARHRVWTKWLTQLLDPHQIGTS